MAASPAHAATAGPATTVPAALLGGEGDAAAGAVLLGMLPPVADAPLAAADLEGQLTTLGTWTPRVPQKVEANWMEASWSALLQASCTQQEMPSMNSFLAQMHFASVAGQPPICWPDPETKLFKQPFCWGARDQQVVLA